MVRLRIFRYIISCFLIVLFFNINAQSKVPKCKKVKRGRFIMVGPQGGSIKIKRTNKIQIERYSRQRIKHRFYIDWIDECNYILTLKKSRIKSIIDDTEVKLYVKIIEVDRYYYTAEIRSSEKDQPETIEIQIRK